LRPVELGFAAMVHDFGIDHAEHDVVVTHQEVVLAAEVERDLLTVDHDRRALDHFASAVDDARRKAGPTVVRVTFFVPVFLPRRKQHDDARNRTLVRDAMSILQPESLPATSPTESLVGRANASLGDFYRHRCLPFMWSSRDWFGSHAWPTVKRQFLPSAPAPRSLARTASTCLSWLHPLKDWSGLTRVSCSRIN